MSFSFSFFMINDVERTNWHCESVLRIGYVDFKIKGTLVIYGIIMILYYLGSKYATII